MRFSSAPPIAQLASQSRKGSSDAQRKALPEDRGEEMGPKEPVTNAEVKSKVEVHERCSAWMASYMDATIAPCLLSDIVEAVRFMKRNTFHWIMNTDVTCFDDWQEESAWVSVSYVGNKHAVDVNFNFNALMLATNHRVQNSPEFTARVLTLFRCAK